MPPDLAQQLRDIHEPAIPGFWPLTVSWWVVFGFVLALVVVVLVWYVRRRYRLAPYKRIRYSAKELTQQRETGVIDGLTYASGINLLFKELLLDIEDRKESTTAFGASWQELLAVRFNNQSFISGAGRCLGTDRFSSATFTDDGLSGLVQNTLWRVKPGNNKQHA